MVLMFIAQIIKPYLPVMGMILIILMTIIAFMHVHITDGNAKVFSGIVGGIGILYVGLYALVSFTPTYRFGGDSYEDGDPHEGGKSLFDSLKNKAHDVAMNAKASASKAASEIQASASKAASEIQAEASALAQSAHDDAMIVAQDVTNRIDANVQGALDGVNTAVKDGAMGAFE
jgi:hypothetical protein